MVESSDAHDVTSDNLWQYRVRPVHCATCKIFLGEPCGCVPAKALQLLGGHARASFPAAPALLVLGIKVKTAERNTNNPFTSASASELHELLAERYFESRGVRISAPATSWLSRQQLAEADRLQEGRPVDFSARALSGVMSVCACLSRSLRHDEAHL